jgi:uncharacterized membrane protein
MAAREIGPARVRLSGDGAQAFIGVARTQMGILKELMSFGGLPQLSRTVTMADGTVINVSSVFGQDTIRITRPVAAGEEGGEEAAGGGLQYVYAVGITTVISGTYQVYRWKIDIISGVLLEEINIGTTVVNVPTLMSNDGSVIVFIGQNSFGYTVIRWTAATGAVDIGVRFGLYTYGVYGSSVSLSKDGTAITGFSHDNINNSFVFYWSAKTGVVNISHGIIVYDGSTALVSADGSTVAFYSLAAGAATLCRWNIITGLSSAGLPASGVVGSNAIAMSDDGSTIVAVMSDPSTNHNVVQYRNGVLQTIATEVLPPYNGIIRLAADGSTVAWLTDNVSAGVWNVRLWSSTLGLITIATVPIDYSNYANTMFLDIQIASNGSVVNINKYNPALPGWTTYQWTQTLGATYIGINTSGGIYSSTDATVIAATSASPAAYSHAIRWTKSSGVADLGTLGGQFSNATALSFDGLVVGGHAQDMTGANYACLWTPSVKSKLRLAGNIYNVTKVLSG